MGDTKTDLVNDLLAKPESELRDIIVKRAKKGVYHDFETSLATPKMQLRSDLLEAGFRDLAKKVIDGDYDDESMPRQHGPAVPPKPKPAIQQALETFEYSIRRDGFSGVAVKALLRVVREECAEIADKQAMQAAGVAGTDTARHIATKIRALKDKS